MTSPDSSTPSGVDHRFIKTRLGWRVETSRWSEDDGMALTTEPLPFAFTWRGIQRKAARAAYALSIDPCPVCHRDLRPGPHVHDGTWWRHTAALPVEDRPPSLPPRRSADRPGSRSPLTRDA